jgi:type II restriction/modification system DNA methylase subunit YeeA
VCSSDLQIAETSKKAVIDRVAYTWFNRFCALRFMDANRYNRIGVVSPAEGFTQPEILQEAKQGYIDADLQAFVDFQTVHDLLGGRRPSADPQQEAYRLLLVGTCNALNQAMPFLFEPIADYTELLMPQDLLSEHSILHDLRAAMTPSACQDVEVIGWLYQFYISERKDEVFEALKQNQKIAPEDIPAATQLFTPHWIVRYLVENSLGRLWMLNHPHSRLVEKMDYYIRPEESETDFLRVSSPEEIKVCDPACGSGHMLTYAFDLLHAIYEEEGYPASDIPRLILEKNLHGIEIDERAGALAAFALAIKARGRDRRFFNREVQPNICVLENISFTDQELKEYTAVMGKDLFTEPLLQTLKQFDQAQNFGSLIYPALPDPSFMRSELERKGLGGNIFLFGVNERIFQVLKQAEFLSSRYHVVIANPPYMGGGSFNEDLKQYAQAQFPDSKSDLFAMFIDRNLDMARKKGCVAMITMQSWMFLASYERLRSNILEKQSIISMAHCGPHAFDSIGGEVVSTTAFVLEKIIMSTRKGTYLRLVDGVNESEKSLLLRQKKAFYKVSPTDFQKIPGTPIAYWLNQFQVFENPKLGEHLFSGGRLKTHDGEKYIRYTWEISRRDEKWKRIIKGGEFRKYFGHEIFVADWSTDAVSFYKEKGGLPPENYLKKLGVCWSKIASDKPGFRIKSEYTEYDSASPTLFNSDFKNYFYILGFLNSSVVRYFLAGINPTINTQLSDILALPILFEETAEIETVVNQLVHYSREDWNNSEISWDFSKSPMLAINCQETRISNVYQTLRNSWRDLSIKVQDLEIRNNTAFIMKYGLREELNPEVPLEEITLTCNPNYRYGGNRSETELEVLLLADTMREFISYAVGCMFGRYSLDKPGLVLANQGETLADYLRQVPDPTFLPDEDNAIPVLDGEWFSDDVCERFKKFLKVTFGEQHYEENLTFIENAIGRDIRSYFLKEFYSQHVKMYQKRPIYWMFSSPRGSFNVLIYMHRYQPDTLSVILNRYLREFRGKLEGRKAHLEQVSISSASTQREKTAALKEIESLNKTLEEIRVYERDVLYPLAVQGITIDLDDGVKVNYQKFGKALAKISGLSE